MSQYIISLPTSRDLRAIAWVEIMIIYKPLETENKITTPEELGDVLDTGGIHG